MSQPTTDPYAGRPDARPFAGVALDGTTLAAVLALHRAWRLHGAGGRRADLSDADLSYAVLRGADLRGADLSRADLSGADLRGADLRGADLRGADLRGADLSRADLSGADLRGADLSRADLSGADLSRADLSGADLSDAVLGRTLQRVGPIAGWTMTAVRWADGPRIACGCRWFTVAEAREHWGPCCADRREHGDLMLAGLDALLSICRAHGWEGCS